MPILVTHEPFLSALETGHNKALYKLTFITLLYFKFYKRIFLPD